VRAYDYRNGAHRLPMAALEADVGPYRLRRGSDAVWPPRERAYGGEAPPFYIRHARPIRIATRLTLPVVLLVLLLGSAYLYTDAALVLPGAQLLPGALLSVSDLILPIAWYALHLTNRRYGAPYAFAQLLAGLGIVVLVALANPNGIDGWIGDNPMLGLRAMLAFCASFLFANFIAIITFDAYRGPRWWSAPLAASIAASLVFSALYYPAAFVGVAEMPWADGALAHGALFLIESVALLLPYALLRPAMRPIEGRGGY